MKNEVEQIAQQNDMSIEFVTWFFNEKKANCGNVWFMMMAAMWEGWNACRAAMLAAAPQSPGGDHATAPGKWIPVSEQMPEREVDVQVYCADKKEQMVAYLERNELEGYFRFATWRTGDGIYCQPTHWMQLPAGPQEVKSES
ncbi:TPA: DUF551 domain-containing protein [Klebsiella pneumoniae]